MSKDKVKVDYKKYRTPYNPELHDNYYKPWTVKDLVYLCGMSVTMRGKDLALALGRTHASCLTKLNECRKRNLFMGM